VDGDSGTWSFSLTVNPTTSLNQTAPTSASVTAGTAYSGHLAVTDPFGTVTYATTSATSGLAVSSAGTITSLTSDAPGTYHATGTESDVHGDSGHWSFALTVHPVALHQSGSTTGSVTAGTAFTGSLSVPDPYGTPVFTTTAATKTGTVAALTVSKSGAITETLGADTPVGTYAIAGVAADSLGDGATWVFTLKVKAPTTLVIANVTPPTATKAVAYKFTFVAFGGTTYSWKVSSGTLPKGLKLSTAGVLSGTPTAAAVGRHTFKVKVTSKSKSATVTIALVVVS
jgi:hypothetical protein